MMVMNDDDLGTMMVMNDDDDDLGWWTMMVMNDDDLGFEFGWWLGSNFGLGLNIRK